MFLKFSQYSQANTFVKVSFNTIAGLQTCNSIKKRVQCKGFSMDNRKFLRTAFCIEHLWWEASSGMETFETLRRLWYIQLFRTTLFLEKLLFTLFRSAYFVTTVTFSEQLFFQSSCFFLLFSEQSLFRSSHFFQNSFYFRANIHFLRIRSSLWQLLFGTAFFPLFWIKISKKELLIQSSCTVSTFPEKLHVGKS